MDCDTSPSDGLVCCHILDDLVDHQKNFAIGAMEQYL